MHQFNIAVIILGVLFASTYDNDTIRIHPFIESKTYCAGCHSKDKKNKITDPAQACSQYCITCHKDMKNHHPVNLAMTAEKTHENITLSSKKRITCITCHKPDNPRFDDTQWKSESLYENVFKNKSRYKTYYLIKKNNEGQLCKTCH